jgi:hypothetical protein
MAEIVRAWGSQFPEDIYGDNAEWQARDSAEEAVRQRLRNARLVAIDDVEMAKVIKGNDGWRFQAEVRAVQR